MIFGQRETPGIDSETALRDVARGVVRPQASTVGISDQVQHQVQDAAAFAGYARNWGESELRLADVAELTTKDLPGVANLAWASFPCQDLSLAGSGAGLRGERSGTFWPFWNLMEELADEGRAPLVIVLENVCGALTSHGGEDFTAISTAIAGGVSLRGSCD